VEGGGGGAEWGNTMNEREPMETPDGMGDGRIDRERSAREWGKRSGRLQMEPSDGQKGEWDGDERIKPPASRRNCLLQLATADCDGRMIRNAHCESCNVYSAESENDGSGSRKGKCNARPSAAD
jgi:hypothetical protein